MHKAKGVATMVFFADIGLFCVYVWLFCIFRALWGVVVVLLRVYRAWSCEPQNASKSCEPQNASKRKELLPGLTGVCTGLFYVYTGLFCVYRTLCFYMHSLFCLYIGFFWVHQKKIAITLDALVAFLALHIAPHKKKKTPLNSCMCTASQAVQRHG